MQSSVALIILLATANHLNADENAPARTEPGQKYLQECIRNPAIPMIVDATVTGFNKSGHGKLMVHAIYRAASVDQKGQTISNRVKPGNITPPGWIRGYEFLAVNSFVNPFTGKPRKPSKEIMPLNVLLQGQPGRYLFFLDGELLYRSADNRFPIRKAKNGRLEVGTKSASCNPAFIPGGPPWQPLDTVVKLIPGQQ